MSITTGLRLSKLLISPLWYILLLFDCLEIGNGLVTPLLAYHRILYKMRHIGIVNDEFKKKYHNYKPTTLYKI